ncbi:MAG: sigma-70 family RNA polymerase sigma factor [Bacteroidetes bacterium]|nr:sigma-70 family RNA polymerase sigma factor [Bacteroidota bacterium]
MEPDKEKQQIEDSKTDPKCFEPLYIKYYEQILRFVYKRIEGLDDSREVTAIVFTKALTNISKYTHMGFPLSSWLYRIAINEINLFYRHTKKTRIISLDMKAVANIAEEENPGAERIVTLKKSLTYLSEEELLLIELRYFEERPFAEIGEILAITENNAKVKTYRVLKKLREVYARID